MGDVEQEILSTETGLGSAFITDSTVKGGADEPVYIAVGGKYEESESTLLWALRNNHKAKKFVLVHVHCPAMKTPVLGASFHVSQLKHEEVEAYRVQEREKIDHTLKEYMLVCEMSKMYAETLVIEIDDVAKGLVLLIRKHKITKLVMGAAADKYYTKEMLAPQSRTACKVLKDAPPSCNIWFVCKGNLICSSDMHPSLSGILQPSVAGVKGRYTLAELIKMKSLRGSKVTSDQEELPDRISGSSCGDSSSYFSIGLSPEVEQDTTAELQTFVPEEGCLVGSLHEGDNGSSIASDVGRFSCNSMSENEDSKTKSSSVFMQSMIQLDKDTVPLFALKYADDLKADDDWDTCLQQAITAAAKLINGAQRILKLHSIAEKETLEADTRAKIFGIDDSEKVKQREEIELQKMEIEKLRIQLDEAREDLRKANEQKSKLESLIENSVVRVDKLENKLTKEQDVILIPTEGVESQKDQESQQTTIAIPSISSHFLEFSFEELKLATCNFDPLLKIGEGRSGNVYKGFLHHASVAIKFLHPHCLPPSVEFHNKIEFLSKFRHPNLVSLLGACSEERALVYEFMPNGSLEDHLNGKYGKQILPWQIRARIAAEICSALIFLHFGKPRPIVHGDLRPANILLDANMTSKLADFGMNNHLTKSNTELHYPTSSIASGKSLHMDPEFISTGELTTDSDIYSFGVMLLQLLTSQTEWGIVHAFRKAMNNGQLQELVSYMAGKWPSDLAQQLASMGLKCCELKHENRPDLRRDVWEFLAPWYSSDFEAKTWEASYTSSGNDINNGNKKNIILFGGDGI